MSTINVSNISDGTKTVATTNVTNGSSKAWGNAVGTGTVALRDSFNTSSVVDFPNGQVQFHFTNSFANTDYCQNSTTNNWHAYMSDAGKTVSSTYTVAGNSSHTKTDSAQMNYTCFGDLA